jgi:hypothetical protein
MEAYLKRASKIDGRAILEQAGRDGVAALERATPKDSGLAARSWRYEVRRTSTGYGVFWYNSDVESGYNVVIGIQYGHGTGTGGYVKGQDFINPAMRPIFDKISEDIRKVVTSA